MSARVWVELPDSVLLHTVARGLAKDLGVEPVTALGHVVSLWAWAAHMAPDGCLEAYDWGDVEAAALWDGAAYAFCQAAIARGILTDHGQGHLDVIGQEHLGVRRKVLP